MSKSPSVKGFAITPNDAVILPIKPKKGVYVGGTGDVAVILAADDPNNTGTTGILIFKNVPAGTVLDIIPKRVMLAGTTATHLIGLL
jgi:hypothetical protein